MAIRSKASSSKNIVQHLRESGVDDRFRDSDFGDLTENEFDEEDWESAGEEEDIGDEIDGSDKEESGAADEAPSASADGAKTPGKKAVLRHILDLKKSLDLDNFKRNKALKASKRKRHKENRKKRMACSAVATITSAMPAIIETLASRSSSKPAPPPGVVVFEDPRKKRRLKPDGEGQSIVGSTRPKAKHDQDEAAITMKQARFDVFKFGARGLDKEGQNDARVALAIQLGAKPSKRPCLPYQQYKMELKVQKENQRAEQEMRKLTGTLRGSARPTGASANKGKVAAKAPGKSNRPGRKVSKGGNKSSSSASGGLQPKIGKFDGGMLKLSAKDLSKIKGSK